MRSVSRSRDVSSTGQGGTVAARVREAEHVLEKARALRAMVWSVNPEEFNWQDAHYDHVDKRLSKQELRPEIDDPMLRAHFHLQDRPGAFLTVVDSINVLRKDLRLEYQAWSISYARLEVLTGQVATGQLTIRADIPVEKLEGWSPDPIGDIECRRETIAAEEVTRQATAGSPDGLGRAENPVTSISRMMKPWSS